MSRIHYFQRYSSVENSVTNNTLLLFSRIYEHSHLAAASLIAGITDIEVELGLSIEQQTPGISSTPDGSLTQNAFNLRIETKVEGAVDQDQLLRHADSLAQESGTRVLLLLTAAPANNLPDDFGAQVGRRSDGALFKAITFRDLCTATKELFEPHEREMRALVDEYFDYCNELGVYDDSDDLMRAVPCGQSYELNMKHGIYFQPSYRGYSPHGYVGIYTRKAVIGLWRIDTEFDVEIERGKLVKSNVLRNATDEYDDCVLAMIEDAREECGWDISTGHRFFCGQPFETRYRKTSAGGMPGARFFGLKDELAEGGDAQGVARLLRDKTWR